MILIMIHIGSSGNPEEETLLFISMEAVLQIMNIIEEMNWEILIKYAPEENL